MIQFHAGDMIVNGEIEIWGVMIRTVMTSVLKSNILQHRVNASRD